jgi:hypothetical protein
MFNCFPAFLRSFYCALRRAPCSVLSMKLKNGVANKRRQCRKKKQAAPSCGTA